MELQSKRTVRIPMDDEEIVELYWNRNERAIEETDFKYKKYLFSIAYNIVHDKLDSEECLNDTYLGAWKAIPPTKPNVLIAFLTTITRRIAIKRYHSNLKQCKIPSEMTLSLSELEDFITGDDDVDPEFLAVALLRIGAGPAKHAGGFHHLVRQLFLRINRLYTEIRENGLHHICHIGCRNGAAEKKR